MMNMLKYLKITTAVFLFCFCGIVLVVWGAGGVSLNPMRGAVESFLSDQSNRIIKLDGDLTFGISSHPYIEFHDLKILDSTSGNEGTLLRLEDGRIGVRVLSLFAGQLRVRNAMFKGLVLDLQRDADGRGNWLAQESSDEKGTQDVFNAPGEAVSKNNENYPRRGGRLVVDEILFQDIHVVWHPATGGDRELLRIDQWTGALPAHDFFRTQGKGLYLNRPFNATLEFASFAEFLRENSTWMRANLRLASSVLDVDGRLDLNPEKSRLALGLSLSGQDLSYLSSLTGLDLPPIKDFQVSGKLNLVKGLATLQDLTLRSQKSRLTGYIEVGKEGDRRTINAQLRSPMIQLDDFLFDEWSWIEKNSPGGEAPEDPSDAPKRLLIPETLARADIDISLLAEKVVSGADGLGGGQFHLNILNGALKIDPFTLDLPGGAIRAKFMLTPVGERLSGTIQMKMENFDFGVWARRKDPNTTMGGLVSLDMDVTGTGETLRDIMGHSNGYLDFSGQLRNIESSAVDLWAVNLVRAALFATAGQKSYINCGVGRWTATNGTLKPDIFFIDTTGIRICGTGGVDLKEETVDMLFAPTAKKAQFYSVAAPVKVKGGFDDIAVRLSKSELVGTTLTLLTSPLHVPLRWIFEHPIPEDGTDVCSLELGPNNRDYKVRGCFRENDN